jgi:tRNA A-37 threonylcarbamoyl transferase component Bud32
MTGPTDPPRGPEPTKPGDAPKPKQLVAPVPSKSRGKERPNPEAKPPRPNPPPAPPANAPRAAVPAQPAAVRPAATPVPGKPVPPRPAVAPAAPVVAVPAKPLAPAAPKAAATPAPGKPAAAPARSAPAAKGAVPAKPAAGAPKEVMKGIQAQDPLVGTTLGRCKIEARIGSGKTAVVYRAHHTGLDAVVAVKVLTPQARAIPEVVEKFATEARAIAKIDNENVLKIYDVGLEGEQHFLVMELLDGESILDLITREGRLEPLDALRVARQASNGLAAAHAQGIIHRDVKPENLVLLEDGTVKLVDFGLAARDDAGSQRVGTPHYMAPEICSNGQAEPVSDVYALGITLFHMLTGAPPYAGQQVKEILQSHIAGAPLYPERKVPGVTKSAADLLRRMTKHEPMLRPTAAEVVAELDQIGGQDLRKKETLRGRKARYRGRGQGKAARSSAGLIVAGVAVVGGIGLFLALSSGGPGKGGTTETPPSSAGNVPVFGPGKGPESNVPLPHVETPEEAAQRVKREEEVARQKKEAEAAETLKGLEGWIRAKWQTKSDDEAVLARYRNFRDTWKGTEAAKTVDDRIRKISGGKMHPHPDRSYGDVEKIEAARKQLAENLPKVEEHIAKHEYQEAQALLPEAVEDMESTLGAQLRFWRQATEHLAQFQAAVAANGESIPKDQRTVTIDGEEWALKKVLPGGAYEVEKDATVRRVTWAEVPKSETFRLAKAALAEKDVSQRLLALSFAWAHRLSDEFWETILDLKANEKAAKFHPDVLAYERSWEDRTR